MGQIHWSTRWTIEAKADGTPVVGFDAGGIAEVVCSGRTGLLVPKGDLQALCAALRKCVGDESYRLSLAGACRSWVSEKFNSQRQAEAYMALYETLLASSPGEA